MHGDIAEIMEIFGVKKVGGFGIRKILSRFITVKSAAFVHGIPLDKFLKMVQTAVDKKQSN